MRIYGVSERTGYFPVPIEMPESVVALTESVVENPSPETSHNGRLFSIFNIVKAISMFAVPATPPSTSIVLSGVPNGFGEDDVFNVFKDLAVPEKVVFHWMGGLFLNCATVVFSDMKDVQAVTLKLLGKVIGKEMTIAYSFRPYNCSDTHPVGKMNMRAPLDDRGFPKDPYAKGTYQYDWHELVEFPDLPDATVCVSLRWNLIKKIEAKAGFAGVEELYLKGNDIEVIDEGVSFPALRVVDLSFNKIKKLPDLSVFCPSVSTFDGSHNCICEIHEGIGTLKNIRVLNLSFNEITHVPALPNSLEDLLLSNCPITEIAESNLDLSKLAINDTKLEVLPEFVSLMVQEKMLVRCNLTSVPLAHISNSIVELSLRQNQITEVPPELFKLPDLTNLCLCHNRIRRIPDEFSGSKLRTFDISENPISELPRIPDTLEELNIGLCEFTDITGFVPDGNKLTSLHATGNKLTRLPQLNEIELLLVAGNELTTMPDLKPSVPLPMTISFAFNKLEELPANTRTRFLLLDLSHNQLKSIPQCYLTTPKSNIKLDGNPIEQVIKTDIIARIDCIDCLDTKVTFEGSRPTLIREIVTNEAIPKSASFSEQTTPSTENAVYVIPKGLSYSETIGGRVEMEDALIIRDEILDDVVLVTVLDGHAGRKAARFAASSFPELIAQKKAYDMDTITELVESFNEKLISINEPSGATMEMLFINKHERKADVYHVGDARCVMFDSHGTPIFTTTDHRPENRIELERLRAGKIALRSMKACGRLGTSGALGDVQYPGMRLIPEHFTVDISTNCKWIVVACDGLFDELTNEDVGETIARYGYHTSAVILRDQAYSRGSIDNISVIVIDVEEMLK